MSGVSKQREKQREFLFQLPTHFITLKSETEESEREEEDVLPCYGDRHAGNETWFVEDEKRPRRFSRRACRFLISVTSNGLIMMPVSARKGKPGRQQMLFFLLYALSLSLSPFVVIHAFIYIFAFLVVVISISDNTYPPRTSDGYLSDGFSWHVLTFW